MRMAIAKVVRREGSRSLATRKPLARPMIPPMAIPAIIEIQIGIPPPANHTAAVPEKVTMAPREKSIPPMVKALV